MNPANKNASRRNNFFTLLKEFIYNIIKKFTSKLIIFLLTLQSQYKVFYIYLFYKMRVLFFLLLASALSLNVLAQRATSPTEGCAPLTVSFEAPATSSTYYWDMGDGAISDKEKPSNQYVNPGKYTATFRESKGGPVLGSVDITVYQKPVPAYVAEPAIGCPSADIKFKNSMVMDPAIKVSEYYWVFGDGYGAYGDSVVHAYSAAGNYKISLTFTTNFSTCNDNGIIEDPIKIYNRPQAAFTTDPGSTFTCENDLKVSFANVSVLEKDLVYDWNWDFGNGNKTSEKDPLPQDYTKGQYYSRLKMSFKDAPVCSSQVDKAISVGKPVANIQTNKDTVCVIDQVIFRTTSVGSLAWEITGGGYMFIDYKDSIGVNFQDGGWHKVKLTVRSEDGLCYDTASVNVYVQKLEAKIQSTPDFNCSNPSVITYKVISSEKNLSYNWSFDDLVTYKTATVTKTYKSISDSLYYGINKLEVKGVHLKVTSLITGCSAEDQTTDTIYIPNARFVPNKTKGCGPLTVVFSDSSKTFPQNPIVSWKWLFGDDQKSFVVRTDSNDVSFTYNTPGVYYARLVVTTLKGCVDTSYAVKIEVGEKVASQLDFTVTPSQVCPGEKVSFSVKNPPSYIDAYHFQTEDNRSFHCSDLKDASWSYNNVVGPQDVSLSVDYNGCISTVKKSNAVTVNGAIPKIDYLALCNDPLKYTFTSNTLGAAQLSWDFGEGPAGTSVKEVYNFAKSGDYQVKLTATPSDGFGCKAKTEIITVTPRVVKAFISYEKEGDSLYCISSNHILNASLSQDVYASCHRGYTWQFPTMKDMLPRTTSNPAANFLFSEAGEHKVRLIVEDVNGCKDTATARIKIYDMTVDAKPNKEKICLPNGVSFADLSVADTTIVAWKWNFLNDTIVDYTTFRDSVARYFKKGISSGSIGYSLTLTDQLGCKETYSSSIQLYTPVTTIQLNPRICVGDTVEIKAFDFTAGGSSLDFLWNMGFGPDTTGIAHKVVYKESGRYPVSLNYTEKGSGCSGYSLEYISVQSYPKAKFSSLTIDTLAVICADISPVLRDSSKATDDYSPILRKYWEADNQPSWDNSKNPPIPSWSFPRGDHYIKLKVVTENGCPDDTTGYFRAENAEGNFIMSKNTICLDEEITFSLVDTIDVKKWEWNFEGDTISDVDHVTHKFTTHPENNISKAKLKLTSWKGGCFRAFEKDVFVHPVIARFERESEPLDTSICFNDGPFHLKNTSINNDKFKWNFGDGTAEDSVTAEPAHKFTTPGQYDVTLTIRNSTLGCVDTLTKVAVVYPNPKVIAEGDTMCFDSQTKPKRIELKVKNEHPGSKYHWSPADGLSDVNIANPIASPDYTTLYKVVETDTASGCTDFTEVTGLVVHRIDMQDWDTTIVIGDIATLPLYGDPVYKFSWTPESGLSCTDCFYPKAQPLEDITYNLIVTDVYSCFIDPYKFEITVKPETFVKLPSAFTPNGDTKNDKVYVKGWGIKKLIEYKVFNRWGQEIFSTDDINEGWDGTFKGQKQNSDVYVYKVKVITWKEEEKYVEGYINLLY
ncbi:mannosidase-related [Sporocytophaga myxococcoides]|uniref:Mannosidase-related n=2 Tax=Sporocytophaga myxococcoides TaxID=153721 RepID=A0A098LCI1_9BACT|nr:mannosidase-related [Sporocytophaga myxococcoides]